VESRCRSSLTDGNEYFIGDVKGFSSDLGVAQQSGSLERAPPRLCYWESVMVMGALVG